MKRIIKGLIFSLIVFATSFFAFDINHVDATSYSFIEQNLVSATPPSSYDLRDYIHIEVENQNPYGICYAFASLTSLETYLALHYNEYYDFSEVHFATSLCLQDAYHETINKALTSGGNFHHFMLYTQKDKSLVLEQEMPIEDYLVSDPYNIPTKTITKLVSDFTNINDNFYPIVKVNDTKDFPSYIGNKSKYNQAELAQFRNDVKNHIMQYGSVTSSIHTKKGGFNSSTISYRVMNDDLVASDSIITASSDHMISIVGWDDNYDANGAWQNKGAYLCLNSWGTGFGENGYFYVSYDDYFIEHSIHGITNATLSTTNNKISTIKQYQDNTSMFTHFFKTNFPTVYTGNIINVSSFKGENITHIDSFLIGSSSNFYIRFFNTYQDALNGINSVTTKVPATKSIDGSRYVKYALDTPINIADNFMVLVTECFETKDINSLGNDLLFNLGLPTTYYYQAAGIGYFDINEDAWDATVPDRQVDLTIPVILHTDKEYISVDAMSSLTESLIDGKYTQNNAIHLNKQLTINLSNVNLTNNDIANIRISKLLDNSFRDITSNFNISLSSPTTIKITMTSKDNIDFNLDKNNYLIKIPCSEETIYRVISLQNSSNFTIDYVLNGGEADNPTSYTDMHTSLHLNNPIKLGYDFVGWFTDSALTKSFNPNNLPYANLTLYAKYTLAKPTVSSNSNDVDVSYYDGLNVNINVNATHPLLNSQNTLSYQWFVKQDNTFTLLSEETNPYISLNYVNQSGYYACEITITLDDGQTATLTVSETPIISVNISPYVYDMSNAKWNYTEPFVYNVFTHKVELVNLPAGVTATYTNNEFANVGSYTAVAQLIYDDMDGNAVLSSTIDNLSWQIRKAKILIDINDIITETSLTEQQLNELFSCSIQSEYWPNTVISRQDKLDYLELEYTLTPTSNINTYIISATTKDFDIFEISVTSGIYRVAIYSLSSDKISSTSTEGFVKDCVFNATPYTTDDVSSKLLKDNNLTLVEGYNISYSYLDTTATINIPIARSTLLNNVSVYMLKNNKLTKVNAKFNANGLSFDTTESNATYLIVKENNSKLSNGEMLLIILIIAIYSSLCIYAFVVNIKHKKYRY